jgi:hypothetical protein
MNEQKDSSGKKRQTYRWILKAVIVLFVCGSAGFFVPLCGIPLILVILLLLSASTPQMKRIVKIAIVLFVGGAILFRVAGGSFIMLTSLFLPYIAAPILAIIASAIQLRGKPPCGRATHIFLIVFMLGFFLINARTYVIWVSPFIYMPPAITSENIKVYKECIKYVKNHEEMKDLIFYMQGVVSREKVPTTESERISFFETLRRIEGEPETIATAKQLRQIMCARFKRCNDIVIFYKGMSPFLPLTDKEIWHVWPSGHGVAYSLNGQDPNQSDDPILVKYRPYFRIHDNWYFSRGLLMTGDGRQYHLIRAISKTLIDRSSSINSIDTNDLDDFN